MGSLAVHAPAKSTPLTKRRPADTLPAKQRSRVTNGALFAKVVRDGRTGWSRRMEDLLSLYISHMGGEDRVSEPQRSMARRIAVKTVELEWLEIGFAQSPKGPTAEQFDMYLRGSNSLRRYLESIGLERNLKDVTPTLSDYLRENYQTDEADEEESSP
jgi:hypothetical protein